MYSIAGNLREVRERIAASATRSGRDPSGIKLVAVSKGRPLKMIMEAAQAGQAVFGENKAQELRDKLEAIDRELEWHFIGHLQRNKVNMVVGNVAAIHSLDSERLAEAIHRRASFLGVEQDVLIQVNVSGEESKYGVEEDRVGLLIDRVLSLSSLKLRGMMTIAPPSPGGGDQAVFQAP